MVFLEKRNRKGSSIWCTIPRSCSPSRLTVISTYRLYSVYSHLPCLLEWSKVFIFCITFRQVFSSEMRMNFSHCSVQCVFNVRAYQQSTRLLCMRNCSLMVIRHTYILPIHILNIITIYLLYCRSFLNTIDVY